MVELRLFPDQRLGDEAIRKLAADSPYRECTSADQVSDSESFVTPFGQTCAQLRELLDAGYSNPCDARARAACPIACGTSSLCHVGSASYRQLQTSGETS